MNYPLIRLGLLLQGLRNSNTTIVARVKDFFLELQVLAIPLVAHLILMIPLARLRSSLDHSSSLFSVAPLSSLDRSSAFSGSLVRVLWIARPRGSLISALPALS